MPDMLEKLITQLQWLLYADRNRKLNRALVIKRSRDPTSVEPFSATFVVYSGDQLECGRIRQSIPAEAKYCSLKLHTGWVIGI